MSSGVVAAVVDLLMDAVEALPHDNHALADACERLMALDPSLHPMVAEFVGAQLDANGDAIHRRDMESIKDHASWLGLSFLEEMRAHWRTLDGDAQAKLWEGLERVRFAFQKAKPKHAHAQ